jgi:3'-phosphoadenosine 5'-phosphosulfate (PAPS) 3'-phosphatase
VTYNGEVDTESLNPHLFPAGLFSRTPQNESIPTSIDIDERVTVWVDPLDGTLSYVNNELDAVTTLIGLSIGSEPVLGVIGHPYAGTDAQFKPQVYFGYTNQKKVFYCYGSDIEKNETFIPFDLPTPQVSTSGMVICTSKNRIKEEVLA